MDEGAASEASSTDYDTDSDSREALLYRTAAVGRGATSLFFRNPKCAA